MSNRRGLIALPTWQAGFGVIPVFAFIACDDSSLPAVTFRDSLGVSIVESALPQWTEDTAWRMEETPIVDLTESGAGDEHQFYAVRDVLSADSNHLVVADGGSQQLRIYDSAGRFQRAFGGTGDGPGEFQSLRVVVALLDGTLVAQDGRPGGRIVEFDVARGLTATFRRPEGVYPLRQPIPSTGVFGFEIEGVSEDGMLLGLQRPVATVVQLSEDRTSRVPIASVPHDEVFVVARGDAIPLMGRRTHIVPIGSDEIALGTADALGYSRIDARTGAMKFTARIVGVSLAVSRREIEAERRARLGPNPSARTLELFAELPDPKEKPAYQRLLLDVEGNVWAGEYMGLARRDEPQRWYVWDRNGQWLGVVQAPARFEVMRVGSDRVFGVRRASYDTEHPQVLRLRKGSL